MIANIATLDFLGKLVLPTCPGTHGLSRNKTSFNKCVWIVSHDLTIFTGSRFSLVSIHNQVPGPESTM